MTDDRSAPSGDRSPDAPSYRARVRYLTVAAARWIAVGAAIGVGCSLGLLAVSTPKGATDTAFALGALVLGFGVTAWSTSVGMGETIRGVRQHLEVESNWTEAGARQAFFVLSWTGAGWMIAAALASVAFGVD